MSDVTWDDDADLTIEQCLAAGSNGVMIPNEHYHRLGGISGSKLKLLAESNAHLDNYKIFDMGDKSCFNIGTYTHTLVLEPHLDNAVVMPKFETKQETGYTIAEQQQKWLESNKNALILSTDDYANARGMAFNVGAICGDIIAESICERSLFVKYHGITIKCRIDAQHGPNDYDLKTITPQGGDFSEAAIRRHCLKMGYFESAAFRNIVREQLGMPTGHSFFIFVSTSPGHMVKVRKISNQDMDAARENVMELLTERRLWIERNIEKEIKDVAFY